jgi:hypothetical protein
VKFFVENYQIFMRGFIHIDKYDEMCYTIEKMMCIEIKTNLYQKEFRLWLILEN